MSEIQNKDHAYIASTYSRFPVSLVKGKGSLAWDEDGKEYIDMGAGIGVNSFGYCDDEWINAVEEQLRCLSHSSNLYYTSPDVLLAEKLCQRTGMKKVFFSNSGAEANECMIKACRKYAAEKKGSDCYTIITLKNSFHGRTLTTLAATGQDAFHKLYQPLTPGFVYAGPDDLSSVEKLIHQYKTAGIMFECVQGEGGVNALKKDFVKGLAALAAENDILLLVDEVQSGNGRCGALYSYENYGIMPDAVTTAKGLGGGLPIGVTMLSEKLQNIFSYGDNGSTFGGNPVVCAGALSILNRIDDDLLQDVRKKSAYLFDAFSNDNNIKAVTGMGLMIGIEPAHQKASDAAVKCLEKGVLVLTAGGNKIRLLPALNIPMELVEKAAAVIKEVLDV